MVTYPYAYMTYTVSPLAGLGGGKSWRPPAYKFAVFVQRAYFSGGLLQHEPDLEKDPKQEPLGIATTYMSAG